MKQWFINFEEYDNEGWPSSHIRWFNSKEEAWECYYAKDKYLNHPTEPQLGDYKEYLNMLNYLKEFNKLRAKYNLEED